MVTLSKSKLLAYRQCPRRLWLEIHCPQERQDSPASRAMMETGNQVGALARRLYDPQGQGTLLDAQSQGLDGVLDRTQALLGQRQPIFEAGFRAEGAIALADVLLPVATSRKPGWRMVEVKSSSSLKDHHRDDAAVQAFVARAAGVPLQQIAVAHIDSSWVYPGGGDYRGLLVETDLSGEAFDRADEVRQWIAAARRVAQGSEPEIATGDQCASPYECGYIAHCRSSEPQAEHPIAWLPGKRSRALSQHIEAHGLTELRDLPDELLNAKQLRIKAATLSGQEYFDRAGAAAALHGPGWPAYFLDFETIQHTVPIWAGTRPFQQVPFQFSVHRLDENGALYHRAFLDLTGEEPSHAFATALLAHCGRDGPIFVYNAQFEISRIGELAVRFNEMANELFALIPRVVDLLPIARNHYYHPSQHGSWRIKAVLPALCPELRYSDLDGVRDGDMAMDVYREAVKPATSVVRKRQIEAQLLAYCALDTEAMVRLWSAFAGVAVDTRDRQWA